MEDAGDTGKQSSNIAAIIVVAPAVLIGIAIVAGFVTGDLDEAIRSSAPPTTERTAEGSIWEQPRWVRELHFAGEIVDPSGRLLEHTPARVAKSEGDETMVVIAGVDWDRSSQADRNAVLRRLVNHLERNRWRDDCVVMDLRGDILWRRR